MGKKLLERRMSVQALELRESSKGSTLHGYASMFDQPYDMGWYTEEVVPGAFARSLGRSPDVRLLINHAGLPLARTTSGTLDLSEDATGLAVEARLDPTDPDVQSLLPKLRRGDLNQMSIGFRCGSGGDRWSDDFLTRKMLALELHDGDVSVVTYPASPTTSVGVRTADRRTLDPVASALLELESRTASDEDIVSVLTRALGFFGAVDAIVDMAQEELAEALGIADPDEDAEGADEAPVVADVARAAAAADMERRRRLLMLL